jgi:CBS domain-containing protein
MVLVRDIMKKGRIIRISPSASVLDAVKVMSKENVGSVLITDNDKLLGIFTERDLVHHLAKGGSLEDRIEEVMTKDVITLREDESAWKAATIMVEKGIRHLPVVDKDGKLVGVVSIRDVLRTLIASSQWP